MKKEILGASFMSMSEEEFSVVIGEELAEGVVVDVLWTDANPTVLTVTLGNGLAISYIRSSYDLILASPESVAKARVVAEKLQKQKEEEVKAARGEGNE